MTSTFSAVPAPSARIVATLFGASLLGAILSGCGAGAGMEQGGSGPSAAPADAGRYLDMASYCQAHLPDPGEPKRDGWIQSAGYAGMDNADHDSYTVVSPDGSSNAAGDPVRLKVNMQDYRGVANNAQIVPPGYANPDWSMGVVIPNAMSPKSVACVAQLAKIRSVSLPALPGRPPGVSTTLSWRSYWNPAVPMAQLSGYGIDGFEVVSNFTPTDGQAFFVLDKGRYPSTQGMTICYLAPSGGQWSCSQPELTDLGTTWYVRVRGARPGIYVLNAPNPR